MRSYPVSIGEPAPWFTCASGSNPNFKFDTVAGRYILLCFFGSASDPLGAAVRDGFISRHRALFDDLQFSFFGVSSDSADLEADRLADSTPGVRYFQDFNSSVAGDFGLLRDDGTLQKATYLLDPGLRVVAWAGFGESAEQHVREVVDLMRACPRIGRRVPAAVQAPILVVPRIFEPALCRRLIDEYEKHGGRDSGFMRDVNGKTVEIKDYGHKRRRDHNIENAALKQACMVRIHDRLAPEIHKAHQFTPTRMERYIVACYDAEEEGHFRPHRDNTTKGTAHRRFAVSLFLNSGEYEGGVLRFPEYGPQEYTAPLGGAVVFSCSMLHEATKVTRGRRYMFLPFLYDDAAAAVRAQNLKYLDESVLSGPDSGEDQAAAT